MSDQAKGTALALKRVASKPTRAPRARRKFAGAPAAPPRLTVGALCLNCRAFDLQIDDRTVLLTPAEFELLYYLMSHAGEVFSAEQLLCQVWGYAPGAGRAELIRAHIKNLRAKIEPNPQAPTRLRTVGRLGYTIGA